MSQNLSHIWHLWEFNAGLDRLIGVRSTRIPWNKDLNLTHCHQDSEPENRQKKTLAHIVQAITNKQPMNTSKPCLDQSHLTVYLNKVQTFTKREKKSRSGLEMSVIFDSQTHGIWTQKLSKAWKDVNYLMHLCVKILCGKWNNIKHWNHEQCNFKSWTMQLRYSNHEHCIFFLWAQGGTNNRSTHVTLVMDKQIFSRKKSPIYHIIKSQNPKSYVSQTHVQISICQTILKQEYAMLNKETSSSRNLV